MAELVKTTITGEPLRVSFEDGYSGVWEWIRNEHQEVYPPGSTMTVMANESTIKKILGRDGEPDRPYAIYCGFVDFRTNSNAPDNEVWFTQ